MGVWLEVGWDHSGPLVASHEVRVITVYLVGMAITFAVAVYKYRTGCRYINIHERASVCIFASLAWPVFPAAWLASRIYLGVGLLAGGRR